MEFNKLFKSNITLYKIWFFLIKRDKSKKVKLPTRGDLFYFDGYPRSGNTYVYHLLRNFFHTEKSTSHLHVIAGLKIARLKNIPSIVIIRKPQDAIASNLFRKMKGSSNVSEDYILSTILNEYISFYDYVLKNRDNIYVINFDDFLNEKIEEIKKVSQFLNIEILDDVVYEKILKDSDLRMKSKEKNKAVEYSSLPSEERKEFKKRVIDKIVEHPSFIVAESIYNQF